MGKANKRHGKAVKTILVYPLEKTPGNGTSPICALRLNNVAPSNEVFVQPQFYPSPRR